MIVVAVYHGRNREKRSIGFQTRDSAVAYLETMHRIALQDGFVSRLNANTGTLAMSSGPGEETLLVISEVDGSDRSHKIHAPVRSGGPHGKLP